MGLDMIDKLFVVWLWIVGLVVVLLVFIVLPMGVYDNVWVLPVADENANEYCQAKGFDFYESFSRIGLFSEEPVGIKCKYVEQYRQIDINRPLIEISGGGI